MLSLSENWKGVKGGDFFRNIDLWKYQYLYVRIHSLNNNFSLEFLIKKEEIT
jgi:hypothetical protein